MDSDKRAEIEGFFSVELEERRRKYLEENLNKIALRFYIGNDHVEQPQDNETGNQTNSHRWTAYVRMSPDKDISQYVDKVILISKISSVLFKLNLM